MIEDGDKMKTAIIDHSETLDYYMSLPYNIVIVPDEEEGGFTVYYPDLPGCATCIESLDELSMMATDAKREWFKAAIAEGIHINEPKNGWEIRKNKIR